MTHRDRQATLAIYSDTHTAADVTRLLGLAPTKSAERGEWRTTRSGRPPKRPSQHPQSVWLLEIHGDDADAENEVFPSLTRLVDLLNGREAALSALRKNYLTRIWWHGTASTSQGGFVMPSELLAALGRLGCDLFGNLYSPDEHGQD